MKLLILANSSRGLYKFRKELLEELVKSHEVLVSAPREAFAATKIEKIGCKFWNCELLDRRGKNPIRDFRLTAYYKRILKNLCPDIVLTYTIKPNVYGGIVCASLGIPYIVNITGLGTALENKGILQKITLLLYKIGLRNAKKVFFQNRDNQDFMIQHGLVKDNYDLLPGSGVDVSEYRYFDYPEEDKVEFAFVARVMKEKGIDQYLDAAKYIRRKYPKTVFHVCGFCEEDYAEELERLVRKGVIQYHGIVDDMIEIYKRVSCVVHPTYYPEGMSNVLLEACACGRPIITTDRAGCREIVEDGVNGFVVKEKDSKDLVEKIEKFLELNVNKRRKMGEAGREKVEKEFDRSIVVKKYMEEISRLNELVY